ncbi:MAG: type I-U CRISPR-associated helicase/endonuclease Cas3 [Rhodospirillales bacterium]|nr:type I-U CRISPR-associated helicase/endonuclease Cas3 [Rhodospirillales bacterium]
MRGGAENQLRGFRFGVAFETLTSHAPFPWQRRLFDEYFARGLLPPAVDIPTGLGKTAVMAVWLLARAAGAALPRRLVYVVDRRTMIDQATAVAQQLRDVLKEEDSLEGVRCALGLVERPLPISTLRGRHADNREWMVDPTAAAIIVGNADTVGSRLLFQGWGLSRQMRPYAAGLLGCDTLVVLDEAHLAGPFERLLLAIERGQRKSPPDDAGIFTGPAASGAFPPPLRVLPLSATPSRDSDRKPLRLDSADQRNEIVRTRLEARKSLTVEALEATSNLADALVDRAWGLMAAVSVAKGQPPCIAVYCDRRADAEKVSAGLRKRAGKDDLRPHVILLAGGRRVRERQIACAELDQHGLIGDGRASRSAPVFLVATSAGEAGGDLNADHLVCDLVAWERMVQRLGRVNRRGTGTARVLVIESVLAGDRKADQRVVARHRAVRNLLDALPVDEAGGRQAGPGAVADLTADPARRPCVAAATTRLPLYPTLSRPVVDAWAMTSLADNAGRPQVAPWLHGWAVDDQPQTTVIWRRYLPLRFSSRGGEVTSASAPEVRAFFAAAPPQTAELLETGTRHVVDWLRKRGPRLRMARREEAEPEESGGWAGDGTIARAPPLAPLTWHAPIAFLLDDANRPADTLSLSDIDGWARRKLWEILKGKRLVVDARFGGLKDGLLDIAVDAPPPTIEDDWSPDGGHPDDVRGILKVVARSEAECIGRLQGEHVGEGGTGRGAWQDVLYTPYGVLPEGTASSWLVVQKLYNEGHDEDARAVARKAQPLDAHQRWVGEEAARIATALGLEAADQAMLVAAARHHDDGKAAHRWQRAFSAPSDWRAVGPYAKTAGPVSHHRLNGFRHEFKSTLDAEKNGLDGLNRSNPRFMLALHLIAAHHGSARPAICVDGYDDLPPSVAEAGAHAIAVRFAHLQRQWGPWGLAWWEALLRAADQAASKRLDMALEQEPQRRTATGTGEAE